jgi:soluble lytic murein transglycosylase-like protein
MHDPWNTLTRRDGGARRARFWLATLGSAAAGLVVVLALAAALTGLSRSAPEPTASVTVPQAELTTLHQELEANRAELMAARGRLERLTAVARYSSLYDVPADLAASIYDIALAEGIHPSLGFQLVKVESGFKSSARSSAGAIGYTQLRIKTARAYDPGLSEADLEDRDTNLRIGFRFLKDMLGQFDQDLHMALVAYNRGPGRVVEMLARGEDPANGYAETVLKGVKKGL